MARILIKNGRVWDGDSFFFADILTDGALISKIESNITDEADYIYDAANKTVSAGLVDTHVHMRVHPSDVFSIQAEMSCFPFGVTAAADAGRTRGDMAILNSFMLKNVIFINAHIHNNQTDFEHLEEVLARFGNKAIGIKVYFDAMFFSSAAFDEEIISDWSEAETVLRRKVMEGAAKRYFLADHTKRGMRYAHIVCRTSCADEIFCDEIE